MNKIILDDMIYISANVDIDKCNGMTFLITGANGLLAKYMVDVLIYLNDNCLKEKCTIVALCRNKLDAEYKFKDYILREDFQLLIQNVEEYIKACGELDYVIHAASQANTKQFGVDPVGTLSANTIGTYNLLKLATSKRAKGFLFFSSGAVYGDISEATEFIKETQYFPLDPLDISSCYAEGKRMGENMCFSFYKQYDVPAKIIRIGHTYGPGININDGRVFSDFIKNILENKNLNIKSDGRAKRPFCYISDAIIAFFLVLFKGEPGEAYNMANNNCFISIRQLADILVDKAFKEKNLKVIYGSKKGNDLKSTNKGEISVNIDKICELGWNPKIGVEEGFKRTVMSFLESEK